MGGPLQCRSEKGWEERRNGTTGHWKGGRLVMGSGLNHTVVLQHRTLRAKSAKWNLSISLWKLVCQNRRAEPILIKLLHLITFTFTADMPPPVPLLQSPNMLGRTDLQPLALSSQWLVLGIFWSLWELLGPSLVLLISLEGTGFYETSWFLAHSIFTFSKSR